MPKQIVGYMSPDVSVIMPVFNSGKFLRKAIDSILGQTLKNFELIIVDDGSTDDSRGVIGSYSDPRIVLVCNDKNSGLPFSLNRGVNLAKGKYVARMDGDDICLPQRFEKQFTYLEEHSEVAMVDTIMEYIDEEQRSLSRYNSDVLEFEEIYRTMPWINCLGHSSIMIRQEVLSTYMYKAVANEDYDLWLRMLADGLIIHKIKEPLLLYRIHTLSYTRGTSKSRQFFRMAATKRAFLADQLKKHRRFSLFNLKVGVSILQDYATAYFKTIKQMLPA